MLILIHNIAQVKAPCEAMSGVRQQHHQRLRPPKTHQVHNTCPKQASSNYTKSSNGYEPPSAKLQRPLMLLDHSNIPQCIIKQQTHPGPPLLHLRLG